MTKCPSHSPIDHPRPTREDGSPHSHRRQSILITILLVALFVRCAAAWATHDAVPIFDEKTYLLRAQALLNGKGFIGSYQSWVHDHEGRPISALPQFPGAYQPPGYSIFMAGMLAVGGGRVAAIKFGQVLLSTLTVFIVYLLGRSWFNSRCALVAAAICALYPNLIAFSHLIWSETMYILLFLTPIWLFTKRKGVPNLPTCIGVGVLLGLTALTRSLIVYFMPVLCCWFLWVHRMQWTRALERVAVLLAAMLVVILPWTIRNYFIHDGFVLVETNGPYNIWRGNTPLTFKYRDDPRQPHYRPPFDSIPLFPVGGIHARDLIREVQRELKVDAPTDLQVIDYARKSAWQFIRSDPLAFLERAWIKVVDMWNPTSFLVRHLHPRIQAYGDVHPSLVALICWSAIGSYGLVMLLGLFGVMTSLSNRAVWLIILLILFHTAVSATAFGLTRFRLPLMPLIIICASQVLVVMAARYRQV